MSFTLLLSINLTAFSQVSFFPSIIFLFGATGRAGVVAFLMILPSTRSLLNKSAFTFSSSESEMPKDTSGSSSQSELSLESDNPFALSFLSLALTLLASFTTLSHLELREHPVHVKLGRISA